MTQVELPYLSQVRPHSLCRKFCLLTVNTLDRPIRLSTVVPLRFKPAEIANDVPATPPGMCHSIIHFIQIYLPHSIARGRPVIRNVDMAPRRPDSRVRNSGVVPLRLKPANAANELPVTAPGMFVPFDSFIVMFDFDLNSEGQAPHSQCGHDTSPIRHACCGPYGCRCRTAHGFESGRERGRISKTRQRDNHPGRPRIRKPPFDFEGLLGMVCSQDSHFHPPPRSSGHFPNDLARARRKAKAHAFE